MQVNEQIPEALTLRVEAAVAWFNESSDATGSTFRATGILDADLALQGFEELKLILCGGDRCVHADSCLFTLLRCTDFIEQLLMHQPRPTTTTR